MPEWSSPEMARVAELIRERAGLTFPAMRVRDVEATVQRAIQRRMLAGIPELLRVLDEDAPARDALVAELTIGETYFQRDPAQFELLRRRVLPDLLETIPANRPIRIWSAGCASGEEPYSVAMLLDELDAAGRGQIIGTDIARPRLADAQRALYSKWSLRGTTPEMRARYFAERGRYYELIPRIRTQVDFRYLNLAEDQFPSLAAGIWGMDLILCRNVLIYFDAPTVQHVAERLIASLSENGWLILGASDPAIADRVACDVVVTDAGLVYRRPGTATDAVPGNLFGRAQPHSSADPSADPSSDPSSDPSFDHPSGEPSAEPSPQSTDRLSWHELQDDSVWERMAAFALSAAGEPAAEESHGGPDAAADAAGDGRAGAGGDEDPQAQIMAAYERRDFGAVVTLAEAVPAEALTERSWIAWLRALANQGCLDDAAAVAARALAAQGASAELLYLHAILLLQGGRAAEAAAAARRALYLDRTLIVAHLTLADAQRRTSDLEGSRRSLRNAAVLLASLEPEVHVPAADGDTAGRLGELVRVKLRLLDEAA